MKLPKSATFLTFFLFLFPFFLSAQETRKEKQDSEKHQWEFKHKNSKSGIIISEGQRLKVICKIPDFVNNNKVKGYLYDISEESIFLLNKKGVKIEILKDQVLRINVMRPNRVFSLIYALIAVLVGLLFLSLIISLGVISDSNSGGSRSSGLILGIAIGVLVLALALASPKDTITKPFSEEWNYSEVSQADQPAEKKAIYQP